MALSIGDISNYTASSPLSPGTYHGVNHTVASGENLIIVVIGGSVNPGSIDFQATGGDEAFTKLIDVTGNEVWYLLNPSVETARIETDTSSGVISMTCYSFGGAKASAPSVYDSDSESRSDGQTKDISISPTTSAYIVDIIHDNADSWCTGFTPNGSQTQSSAYSALNWNIEQSYKSVSSGSQTMAWTCSFSFFSGTIYQTAVAIEEGSITYSKANSAKANIRATNTSNNSAKALIGNKFYTRESESSLGTNDDDLTTSYTSSELDDVATNDATRVGITGGGYNAHLYKYVHTNSTDQISVSWDGQTDLAPTTSTVYLQIYNRNSTTWETLDSDNTSSANTDFTLSGSKTTSLSDYYDGNNMISVRVYQQHQ